MTSPQHQGRTILVVDDSESTLEVLRRNLELEGYRVFTATSVPDAISHLETTPADLVITDLKMPKVSGMDLVRHVRENYRETELVMITGYATIEGAVEAIKTGAHEYLSKPFTDDELLGAVGRAFDNLEKKLAGIPRPVLPASARHGLLGESEAMRAVYAAIDKASRASATVILTGESGTGKELVARAIHYGSERAALPFVPVNCGGIPESLLESELFGHVKGAFTGAGETRAGFFQAADGGTIFLDEISETNPAMQVKLLRVLEDREVCMVGGRKPQKVDVRIVAATNKDLLGLVKKGDFREDLYFRVNVIALDLPPLRDRGHDILLLASHFAREIADETGKPTPSFSDTAMHVLESYHWPGNVRELRNVVHRLVVMTDNGVIDAPDLPQLMRFSAMRGGKDFESLEEVEARHIRHVLVGVDGNKTRAASILGIDRKTLRKKIKQYGLE
jgi:DNA-binding NtrC family response regulator